MRRLVLELMGAFMNSSSFLWDFFSSVLSLLGRMNSADEAWLSLLLVALFGRFFSCASSTLMLRRVQKQLY
jgi:hypothetical protein